MEGFVNWNLGPKTSVSVSLCYVTTTTESHLHATVSVSFRIRRLWGSSGRIFQVAGGLGLLCPTHVYSETQAGGAGAALLLVGQRNMSRVSRNMRWASRNSLLPWLSLQESPVILQDI